MLLIAGLATVFEMQNHITMLGRSMKTDHGMITTKMEKVFEKFLEGEAQLFPIAQYQAAAQGAIIGEFELLTGGFHLPDGAEFAQQIGEIKSIAANQLMPHADANRIAKFFEHLRLSLDVQLDAFASVTNRLGGAILLKHLRPHVDWS